MSIKENWLAGAFGFILGRATAPVPGPAAPAYQPPPPPIRIPQSEEERRAGNWRAFAPLHDDVLLVRGTTVSDFPRIFPRLGRQRMDGNRADYLYWVGPGKYAFNFRQLLSSYTHRAGPGWVVLRDEPGWGWDVSEPTLDLEQLRQWVVAESAAPAKLAVVFNWGVLPEQHLPASYLYEPGTDWDVAGEPAVPIPYAWASELGFTELNPFQGGWATAPTEHAEPVMPYLPPATAHPARRPAPSSYPPPLPPPTDEEVWRREADWYPFDPNNNTPWRTSTQLPIYPRVGRRRPDGYRADYLYWLDADTYCFPQPDGYDERRVGPGWVLVREEPGWGWEVSEPTTDLAELEQGLWAKSAAPRPTAATWKWGVLPERALPEHALGGEGLLWHPDDDPIRLLPAGWAESYSFICQ